MKVKVSCTHHEQHIVVTVSGEWTESTGQHTIDYAHSEALKAGVQRIMLDIRPLILPDSGKLMLRYHTGVYIAEILPLPFRTAVVGGRPEMMNHYVETVAMNRGAQFRIFVEEAAARIWLLS